MDQERWYFVTARVSGRTVRLGNYRCTGRELLRRVGPWASVNPVNGECIVFAPPPK